MRFILPDLVSLGHFSVGWRVSRFEREREKKKNWTSANSRYPGSSCWVHTLFPASLVQLHSALSSVLLPLPNQKTLKLHHRSTASQVLCPRLSIPSAEIFLASTTVDETAKHIAWPFPDYTAIFYGSLQSLGPQWYPWVQVTFKVTVTFLDGDWASYSFSYYLASDRRGSDLQANPTSKTAIKDRHVQPVWQSFVGPRVHIYMWRTLRT